MVNADRCDGLPDGCGLIESSKHRTMGAHVDPETVPNESWASGGGVPEARVSDEAEDHFPLRPVHSVVSDGVECSPASVR